MDVTEMTPEELREYALAKEQNREDLTARYMNRPAMTVVPQAPAKQPWEKDVEFEGVTYTVDMRRVKSREFIQMFAKFQKYQLDGVEAPVSDALELYSYVFGGKVDDLVVATVTAAKGYDDFEEIMRIENALFERLDAKN